MLPGMELRNVKKSGLAGEWSWEVAQELRVLKRRAPAVHVLRHFLEQLPRGRAC